MTGAQWPARLEYPGEHQVSAKDLISKKTKQNNCLLKNDTKVDFWPPHMHL